MTDSGRRERAALHFWEYVFFTGATGAIALYPHVARMIPAASEDAPFILLLSSGAAIAFVSVAFLAKFRESRQGRWAVFAAIGTGAFALAIGQAARYSSPAFALWATDAALALCSAGYLLAKRFMRQTERDFMKNAGHVILAGFGTNAVALLLIALAAAVSPLTAGFGSVILLLSATLP